MKKIKIGAAMALTVALVLAGCGTPDDTKDKATGDKSEEGGDYLACMVSDQGGFDDKSFNQSGHEGLMRAVDELGIKKKDAESQSDADYQPNVDAMVQAKCNIIFTVGFKLIDQTDKGAEQNPNTHFGIVDAKLDKEVDNVRPLIFNTAEASFLAGYLAAGMTKTGKVATFGGEQIPSVSIFMDGFVGGVEYYNTENGTTVETLGWDLESQEGTFVGSFEDVSKGQVLSKSFIEQGADIIHPVAGPVGTGALAAAKESNAGGTDVSVIWVDADGFVTSPDYEELFLTSVVKEIGASVFDTIEADKDGDFNSDAYIGDLKNGGVSLAPYHDYEDQVTEKGLDVKVDELKEKIIDGSVKVETKNAP